MLEYIYKVREEERNRDVYKSADDKNKHAEKLGRNLSSKASCSEKS